MFQRLQAFEEQGQRHKKAMSQALAALKKERPDIAKQVRAGR
jgi:hypothetical protein